MLQPLPNGTYSLEQCGALDRRNFGAPRPLQRARASDFAPSATLGPSTLSFANSRLRADTATLSRATRPSATRSAQFRRSTAPANGPAVESAPTASHRAANSPPCNFATTRLCSRVLARTLGSDTALELRRLTTTAAPSWAELKPLASPRVPSLPLHSATARPCSCVRTHPTALQDTFPRARGGSGRTWLPWAVPGPLRDFRTFFETMPRRAGVHILPRIHFDTAHVQLRDVDVVRVPGKCSSGGAPPGLVALS